MIIEIPHYKILNLKHLILDYNGTIAKDGVLIKEIRPLLHALSEHYRLHVITADTFGTVTGQLTDFNVSIKVLMSENHTREKALYLDEFEAESCVCIGNGNNDQEMLQHASLGIALIGDEGCSAQTLACADVVCTKIEDALSLLLNPKRLIATLRR